MINILVLKDNQNIVTIEANGHSGYSQQGSDIVCSAVSTLMQTLANGLTEVVKVSPKIIIDETIPHMHISVCEADYQNSQVLMKTTVLALKNLADSYSKFIKIKEKQK